VILIALLLLLLGSFALSSKRSSGESRTAVVKPTPAAWIQGLKEGEEIASPAAEAIEALAQEKLSQYQDLAGLNLDFGTAEGGGLEIWVGTERYGAVDDIPDDRIREAIAAAVEEFNNSQARADAE
jgi:hypothetical protein